jgi:hypothetical protein
MDERRAAIAYRASGHAVRMDWFLLVFLFLLISVCSGTERKTKRMTEIQL